MGDAQRDVDVGDGVAVRDDDLRYHRTLVVGQGVIDVGADVLLHLRHVLLGLVSQKIEIVSLRINAVARVVVARGSRPCYHELARFADGHVGITLVAVGGVVDQQLAAPGTAPRRGVHFEHPRHDVVADAVLVALPGDHELAAQIHGHAGQHLVAGGGDVHREFRSQGLAEAVVAAGVNAVAVAQLAVVLLAVAGPGDHEVAVEVHGHRGVLLVVGRIGVHPEGLAVRVAVGLVAAGVNVLLVVDAVAVRVAVVRPGNHEVAVFVAGHVGIALVVAGKIKVAGAGRYFN